jgi:hypothetical protein
MPNLINNLDMINLFFNIPANVNFIPIISFSNRQDKFR